MKWAHKKLVKCNEFKKIIAVYMLQKWNFYVLFYFSLLLFFCFFRKNFKKSVIQECTNYNKLDQSFNSQSFMPNKSISLTHIKFLFVLIKLFSVIQNDILIYSSLLFKLWQIFVYNPKNKNLSAQFCWSFYLLIIILFINYLFSWFRLAILCLWP